MIDSLGDVGEALNDAKPEKMEKLYAALRLEMTYNAPTGQVDVAIRPARRVSACVRGGIRPRTGGRNPRTGDIDSMTGDTSSGDSGRPAGVVQSMAEPDARGGRSAV